MHVDPNTTGDPLDERPILRVEDFSKRYATTLAVDRLSFDVARGEILGLVGPNGAGKTTTLRSIAGVLPVKSGARARVWL